MFHGLTGWHLVILLAVILLLFGAAKLPALAKSVGQSARLLKGEMRAMKEDDAVDAQSGVQRSSTAQTSPPSAAPAPNS